MHTTEALLPAPYDRSTRTFEVFRTNVATAPAAELLLRHLQSRFPGWRLSFDLEDCDRVLRVETAGEPVQYGFITRLLQGNGYHCEPLPD